MRSLASTRTFFELYTRMRNFGNERNWRQLRQEYSVAVCWNAHDRKLGLSIRLFTGLRGDDERFGQIPEGDERLGAVERVRRVRL